jgi:hypothetical protein
MFMPFHTLRDKGSYLLFAMVHQRCLSQYGCVHLSKQQHSR